MALRSALARALRFARAGAAAAFGAITQAEERAATLRRRGEQLEAVLATGQRLRLQQLQANLLQPIAEAARGLTGATAVAAYLRDPEMPSLLERILLIPANPVEMGPAYVPMPTAGKGIQGEARRLLVPLESPGADVAGLLVLMGVPDDRNGDGYDALAILATQADIAPSRLRRQARRQGPRRPSRGGRVVTGPRPLCPRRPTRARQHSRRRR